MSDELEVWLDVDFLDGPVRVGALAHDRGTVRFGYEMPWLRHRCGSRSTRTCRSAEPTFQSPSRGTPDFRRLGADRWGQMLMRRREVFAAIDEERPPRVQYAWDFLLGVQDLTRQGALRLRKAGDGAFLASEPLAAPVTSLRELDVAGRVTARRLDDLDALRKWLAVLVAPGASLGGARPKANYTDPDGSLWIAKFPAREAIGTSELDSRMIWRGTPESTCPRRSPIVRQQLPYLLRTTIRSGRWATPVLCIRHGHVAQGRERGHQLSGTR
jgi:serine/threonine-protein kinase HipA